MADDPIGLPLVAEALGMSLEDARAAMIPDPIPGFPGYSMSTGEQNVFEKCSHEEGIIHDQNLSH